MKFTDSHEWIAMESKEIGRVGISDHAQYELGDIVFVELPTVGKKVLMGQEIAVLESTKAAADVYAPVSGEILEVNLSLKEHPQRINDSPEKEGWLFTIKISDPQELDTLFSPEAYAIRLKGRR